MAQALINLNQQIESLSLEAVMLEVGDIPGLGAVLKSLEFIESLVAEIQEKSLAPIAGAMKGYIEMVILGERADLSPFETGISRLQEICRNLINGKTCDTNIASLLSSLGAEGLEPPKTALELGGDADIEAEASARKPEMSDLKPDNQKTKDYEAAYVLSQEDKDIIADFVAESLEHLGTIEISVMDLEQDPSNPETINAIFRPFHTVKGVSGFLNFNKINKLAHAVENLLDKARNGELEIDAEIIDVILDSVDLVKKIIEHVQSSLHTGTPAEGDFEIEAHIDRVEHFVHQTEGKNKKALGAILVEKGAISQKDLEEALDIQKKQMDKKKIGEILVEEKKAEASDVVFALREQKKTIQPVSLQVKIDTDKLDNVVDMVGELAIAQSMLRQNEIIKTSRSQKLDHIINQMNQITSGLQKTSMTLRMVPIGHTFNKMLRLVRDLAKKADKEVHLIMTGEDTEIDRNMVEEIYEPMVHIVRNSMDHGMELPEDREAGGKPRQGTIHLKAYHKGGDIVIEIKDDGRGLNREKILEKALSQGLLREGEKLTEGEINHLIFHPGFSTAEKVTDISGRGVGMDVVKRKIERLRGRVDIQTSQDKGATIFIRLPLTLAILDGMVVKLNGEKYIIPTLSVQESLRPKKDEYFTVKGQGEMIKVRDSLVPLIRLDQLLNLNGNEFAGRADKAPWEKLVVVVENQGRRRCLLIDELLGQEEVVIKSLGEAFKDVKGVAGGAIMGDGRVSLILDIAGIFDITSAG